MLRFACGLFLRPQTLKSSYPEAPASAMFNFLKTAGVVLLVAASSAFAADVRILTVRGLAVQSRRASRGTAVYISTREDDAPRLLSVSFGPVSYAPIKRA